MNFESAVKRNILNMITIQIRTRAQTNKQYKVSYIEDKHNI